MVSGGWIALYETVWGVFNVYALTDGNMGALKGMIKFYFPFLQARTVK